MEIQRTLKPVEFIFTTKEQGEGVGAKVRRYIGGRHIPNLDPFLMLDMARVKLPAAFPDHPHRGFETVSYNLQGEFLHEDFRGHKGRLGPGDVQWMTAGRGIMHSEIPSSYDEESIGFQLWINLDKKNKFCEPRYQEIKKENIPVYQKDSSFKAKVISGEVLGVKGPIEAVTPTYYIDFTMDRGQKYDHPIPAGWNSFILVYKGKIAIQDDESKQVAEGQAALFELTEGEEQVIRLQSLEDQTGLILLAGKPINEPIVQGGPFVLNTKEELMQAYSDFQNGVNGFEGANTWKSQNRKMMVKRQ
ncbi:pirin [Stylonychia lemnae]|uniref:Pirin n=1 Tax=Stylonychia lemnae TaxID=5949 RepID=A0A078BET8_STYLE|nr:pirin [Stylonychia lemnae]|eukprot:CDW91677.1 pirin [Stylonychia lemnae]